MCKYSDSTNYKCPHESLKDSEYCIFHLQDDNKDVDEFNKGIQKILETEEDSIYLNGFYFPPESSDFSAQNFQKKINFRNVIFSGKVDFTEATFSEKADFRIAMFLEETNFSKVTFSEEANFKIATFSKFADFTEATFSEKANFKITTFSEFADFKNSTFSEEANFKFATFTEFADFTEATFSKEANFRNTTFFKFADFKNSTFSKEADFKNAKFYKLVIFRNVEFSDDADFWVAEFAEFADFWNAKFSGDADFWNAKFSEEANFKDAKFSKLANFGDAKFSELANFRDAKFSELANFEGAEFTEKFEFIPDKSGIIIFKNTYFSDNVRIKADMSKCFFANSNIERVDMTDSIWIIDNKPKDSYKICEERQGKLSSSWKELEGTYRRLKQSYQKFGDNSTAGKFYYQEMECKRKQLEGIEKHFWYLFYKKLCGYGERPFNVIWASGLIIFVSSLFFFYWGIELSESVVLNLPARLIDYKPSLNFQWVTTNLYKVIGDWLVCLYTSVITFTTLGYGDVHPIGWSRIVASVEAGIGIIMTALFIFVFTRKMLR